MKHYLLSEQDLDEILWEIEYNLWQLSEKIRDKFIHESEQRCANENDELESNELKRLAGNTETIEF